MSARKRIMIKESGFANFIRSFFQAKADNNESEWLKNLRKINPELADQWADWDNKMTKSMETQRKMLIKFGVNPDRLDAVAKSSGRKIK